MSTNIESLPLIQASLGVGADEDLIIAIAFYLSDGVTPLSLAGISFTATLKSLLTGTTVATLSTAAGQIVISGAASNLLTMTELAAAKAAWAPGSYAINLTASDVTLTRDLFVSSSVFVGAPSPLSLSVIRPAGLQAANIASAVPPLAVEALQSIIVSYLSTLPTTEPGSSGQLWLNGGVLQVS
jgi:hypothetical protein